MKERLLLAFSGGPDSTGLATHLRDREPLLAYVDHRLRGREAQRSERASVRRIAQALGLRLVRTRVRVEGRGEEGARDARYRALEALARRHGCSAIALGHSADDRAETILFQLRRGTGLRGLVGMRAETCIRGVRRVRPTLHVRRAELRGWGAALLPAEDRTNRVLAQARARARHVLLPELAERLGEDPVPLLCALGDLADQIRDALEARARERSQDVSRPDLLAEPAVSFPYLVEALRCDGPPLSREAYVGLRAYLAAGRGDRSHTTPGGDMWQVRPRGAIEIRQRPSGA
jgi:tRNA(Ile)-lysidine synthase